jgi:uncharacterized membrane protein YeaQ/YmgE (transglycosylase-associated protein family)
MTGAPDGGILSLGHHDLSDATLAINSIVCTINVSVASRFLFAPAACQRRGRPRVMRRRYRRVTGVTTIACEAWRIIMDLQPGGVIIWLVVGLVAGWLAGQFMKGSGYGLIGDIVLGIIGAFIGGVVFGFLMPGTTVGLLGSIAVAFVGAIILTLLWREPCGPVLLGAGHANRRW